MEGWQERVVYRWKDENRIMGEREKRKERITEE